MRYLAGEQGVRQFLDVRTGPVGAGNCVTSRDLGIFMDQAAEASPALDTHTGHFSGWMCVLGSNTRSWR